MKLAVIATGQVRSLKGLNNLNTLIESFHSIHADCFVSTWAEAGRKTSGSFNYTQISRTLGHSIASLIPCDCWEQSFSELISVYSRLDVPQNISRDFVGEYLPSAIIDVEDIGLGLEMRPNVFDSNSLRLIYKIWKAAQMLHYRERVLGSKYDYILRCRLDQAFTEGFQETLYQIENKEVYVDFISGNTCGDNIIYGERDHFLEIINVLFSNVILANSWNGIHVEIMDQLKALGLKPKVPKNCPTLLEDDIDINKFQSYLSSTYLVQTASNKHSPHTSHQHKELELSGSMVCIAIDAGMLLRPNASLNCKDLATRIGRIKDFAGLARLLAAIHPKSAEGFHLLATLFYIQMLATDFQGYQDYYSRRFIVYDGIQILAASKQGLSSLPVLCHNVIESNSLILLELNIYDKFYYSSALQIEGSELWNECMKDYEIAREICAIYDRCSDPIGALGYAEMLYKYYGEKEDLIELLFHLLKKMNRKSEALELRTNMTRKYLDNRIISEALLWLES